MGKAMAIAHFPLRIVSQEKSNSPAFLCAAMRNA